MAETVRYINKDLATGSNNGTSSADAYRGVNALERFRSGSGGSTVDRVIFEGAGTYREVFSTVRTAIRTDIAFDAATKTITSAGNNFTTNGFQTGDIIRVTGSTSNDRQYTVGTVGTTTMTVHSTNVLTDEAAGASINIASVTRGANLAALDPGGNGTEARPRRWQFNGSEIDAGVTLDTANGYTWTQSTTNQNEWYVRRSDGSNPSLVQPFCATMDGLFINDSADLDPDMGTVGALSAASPMGWGDNDSIGYSTVYVLASVDPGTMVIRVGQVYAGVSTTWGWHSFEDGIFTLSNRDAASGSGKGIGISNRSTTTWWVKRSLIRYASLHGVEHGGTGTTRVESTLTYFTGHRGYGQFANGTLQIFNSVDYGSHLFFAQQTSGLTASAVVLIRNCISAHNEAGAIDKKSASSVLTEDHNIWYPRFGASGAALGYVSTANWTTTDTTDYPPSSATTLSTQAANTAAGGADPLFVAPSVFSVSATNFKIQSSSVAKRSGKPVAFVRDYRGKKLSLTAPSRGLYQDVGDAQ